MNIPEPTRTEFENVDKLVRVLVSKVRTTRSDTQEKPAKRQRFATSLTLMPTPL